VRLVAWSASVRGAVFEATKVAWPVRSPRGTSLRGGSADFPKLIPSVRSHPPFVLCMAKAPRRGACRSFALNEFAGGFGCWSRAVATMQARVHNRKRSPGYDTRQFYPATLVDQFCGSRRHDRRVGRSRCSFRIEGSTPDQRGRQCARNEKRCARKATARSDHDATFLRIRSHNCWEKIGAARTKRAGANKTVEGT
jgi:hypothetical protein